MTNIFESICVKTHLERDVKIWDEKRGALRALQSILLGIYCTLNGKADHRCSFHFVATEYKRNDNNNQEKRNGLKELLPAILVIPHHNKIPKKMWVFVLFFYCCIVQLNVVGSSNARMSMVELLISFFFSILWTAFR